MEPEEVKHDDSDSDGDDAQVTKNTYNSTQMDPKAVKLGRSQTMALNFDYSGNLKKSNTILSP